MDDVYPEEKIMRQALRALDSLPVFDFNVDGLSRLVAAHPSGSGSFESSPPLLTVPVQLIPVGTESQKVMSSKSLVSKCRLYHVPHPSH